MKARPQSDDRMEDPVFPIKISKRGPGRSLALITQDKNCFVLYCISMLFLWKFYTEELSNQKITFLTHNGKKQTKVLSVRTFFFVNQWSRGSPSRETFRSSKPRTCWQARVIRLIGLCESNTPPVIGDVCRGFFRLRDSQIKHFCQGYLFFNDQITF